MKAGDYVRTKDGDIGRIIRFTTDTIFYVQFYDNLEWKTDLEELGEIEIGDKIIEIVHKGDYVNGYKITTIGSNGIYAEDEEGYLIKMFTEENIKSIVTKEQFESMEYKVGKYNE